MRENFIRPLSRLDIVTLLSVGKNIFLLLRVCLVLASKLFYYDMIAIFEILITHHLLQNLALSWITNKLGIKTILNILDELYQKLFYLIDSSLLSKNLDRISRKTDS